MHSIHNTAVVPYIIAEKVAGRENEKAVTYLVKRAERVYEGNLHFRTLINNPYKDCRKILATFMSHWLNGYNKQKLANFKN